jgi:hypothetical protein
MFAPPGCRPGGRAPDRDRSRSRDRAESSPGSVDSPLREGGRERDVSPETFHIEKCADEAAAAVQELSHKCLNLRAQLRVAQGELDAKRKMMKLLNTEVRHRIRHKEKMAEKAITARRCREQRQEQLTPARDRLSGPETEGGRAPVVPQQPALRISYMAAGAVAGPHAAAAVREPAEGRGEGRELDLPSDDSPLGPAGRRADAAASAPTDRDQTAEAASPHHAAQPPRPDEEDQ